MAIVVKKYEPFGEPGGFPADKKKFEEGQFKADLCQIAQRYSFDQGARIIDAILKEFDVVKKPFGAKLVTSPPKE